MSTLNKVALKVAQNSVKLGENKEAALDPSSILIYIDILTTLIGMFKDCKKSPADAIHKVKAPNLRDKVATRIAVRQTLGGFKEFRLNNGNSLVEAILETGKEMTVEEMKELYEET